MNSKPASTRAQVSFSFLATFEMYSRYFLNSSSNGARDQWTTPRDVLLTSGSFVERESRRL